MPPTGDQYVAEKLERRAPTRTCGNCRNRHGSECRALPPQMVAVPKIGVNGAIMGHDFMSMYPIVHEDTPECTMWQHDRRGIQPEKAGDE